MHRALIPWMLLLSLLPPLPGHAPAPTRRGVRHHRRQGDGLPAGPRTDEPAYGFRVDYRGRAVVLSGDTRPSPNLVEHARGADLLVHEVGRWKDDPALAADPDAPTPNALTPRQMRVIAEHHTDPVEAGQIFARARPKRAVLSHYAMAADDLLPLVGRHDPGRLEVGRDGLLSEIGDEVRVGN